MSNRPFFSIVIPTYNRAGLILETLQTVFDQSFKDFEIIVVDNCSEDNSLELLRPLAEKGLIRLIENPTNLERSRARNIGFKDAKGEYLSLLDSDDFMYKDCLKDAAAFIEKGDRTEFFHNYYELVNSQRKRLQTYHYPNQRGQIKALAKGNFISCIGVFLSRKVYESYHFNEDEAILGSEDWELWIRVRSVFPLGVIPKINHGIRHHAGRSVSAYELDGIAHRKNYIIDHLMKNPSVKAVFGAYEKDMRASALVFAATAANQAGLFKQAGKLLKAALRKKPSLLLESRFLRVSQISLFKLKKNSLDVD